MKRTIITAALLVAFIFIAGCSIGGRVENPGNNTAEATTSQTGASSVNTTTETVKKPDPVKQQVDSLTLDEKLGQMLIFGIEGKELDERSRAVINEYKPGGIILFGENIEDSSQLLYLVNSVKAAGTHSGVPPFISVDEEGGRVSRMPPEIKKLPSNLSIGKIGDEDLCYRIGGVIAGEMKAFGFNMDFAPVLDIFSNPKNTVIGDRSFGKDADTVKRLGVRTMDGIRSGGVIPVVKHFPGHGDTLVDSHMGLPVVNYGMDRLKSFELAPFDEAVKEGADAVMIAHILLPELDPVNPASFSRTVITDILRNQMNFNGVVITDDMTMGAIIKNFGIADAAVKAVNAGSDLILVAHGYENEEAVAKALKSAAESGIIAKERIDESVYRILALKSKYNLDGNPVNSVDIEKINKDIGSILDIIEKKEK